MAFCVYVYTLVVCDRKKETKKESERESKVVVDATSNDRTMRMNCMDYYV